MSKSVFYADLDKINGIGVLVTGHGKGLVSRNSNIEGEYISNDIVRLTVKNNVLYGYQGYIEEENELTPIDYLLYFYDKSEPNQPKTAVKVDIEIYLQLCRHNIEIGEIICSSLNVFDEFKEILKQSTCFNCFGVPFTDNENERAIFVDNVIRKM